MRGVSSSLSHFFPQLLNLLLIGKAVSNGEWVPLLVLLISIINPDHVGLLDGCVQCLMVTVLWVIRA